MSWAFQAQIDRLVDDALAEDLGSGDITTELLIPGASRARADIVVKGHGVLAGVWLVERVFQRIDSSLEFRELIPDGTEVSPGDKVATIEGAAASILRGERTALNFLQHLSGIATQARRYVEAVSGLNARIVDTRKTIPGLRSLEKYAVRVGGGHNHRRSLGDGILIKENHLAVLAAHGIGLKEAVNKARANAPPTIKVEVEVENMEQARQALEAGADIIMLDNMGVDDMRRCVELCRGRALIEASGGITVENVRAVAETGVDLISVGALTHSVTALDISLDLEPL